MRGRIIRALALGVLLLLVAAGTVQAASNSASTISPSPSQSFTRHTEPGTGLLGALVILGSILAGSAIVVRMKRTC